jgi:hypothetical protein
VLNGTNDCAPNQFVVPTKIFGQETDILHICGNGAIHGSDPAPVTLATDDDVFSSPASSILFVRHATYTSAAVSVYQTSTYYTITWSNMTQSNQSGQSAFQVQIPTIQAPTADNCWFFYNQITVDDDVTPLIAMKNNGKLSCHSGDPHHFASCDHNPVTTGTVLRMRTNKRPSMPHNYSITAMDNLAEWIHPESHHAVLDMDEDGCAEYKSDYRIYGIHPFYVYKLYFCQDGIVFSSYHNSTLFITDYNIKTKRWYLAAFHTNLTAGTVYIDDNDGNVTISWVNMLHPDDVEADDVGSGEMAPAMFYDMDESHLAGSAVTDEFSFQVSFPHNLEPDGSIRMTLNYRNMNTTNVDTHFGKKGLVGVYSSHGGLFCYSGSPNTNEDCETQTFQNDLTLEIKTFPHSSNEWPPGAVAGLVIGILLIITILLMVRRSKTEPVSFTRPERPIERTSLFHSPKKVL